MQTEAAFKKVLHNGGWQFQSSWLQYVHAGRDNQSSLAFMHDHTGRLKQKHRVWHTATSYQCKVLKLAKADMDPSG